MAVVKLLEAMNYDLKNENEVEIDAPVQIGHKEVFADYKISANGDFFVLEAKAPTVEIEDKPDMYNQIHSYYRVLHCKYGVLYNGKKLILFKEDTNKPVYIWRFEKDKDDLSVFEALSKDNFPGALEEFLTSVQQFTKLRQYIENKRPELQDILIDKISAENGISDKVFISDHVEVKVDYTSNLSEAMDDIDKAVVEGGDSVLLKSFRYTGPETGLEFIKKYKAWGFIRVKGKPDYLALYDVDNRAVTKVFRVIESAELNDQVYKEFSESLSREEYEKNKNQGKKILRLGDEIHIAPIPAGKINIFRGKYTTLEKVKSARTTDDL